tara:strand:+ start:1893 stop:2351 length:459 start_codon:yes stop_codon:yes gene_type:complete
VSIKENLQKDLKQAILDKNNVKKNTIRYLLAEIKNREIDNQKVLDDDQVSQLIARQLKQRKESISMFEKGGRTDLVEKETQEIVVLQSYQPAQLSNEKITEIITETIKTLDTSDTLSIGMVMKSCMPLLKGKADGQLVKTIATELLESHQKK